jgi:outer membrane protein assembly factor BamB
MRIISLIFFILFIYNCTPKINLEVSINDLKKEGTLIYESKKNTSSIKKNIKNINTVSLYKKKKILNWNSPEYNASNLLVNADLAKHSFEFVKSGNFKKIKNNLYKKNLLVTKKNIIYVDDHSFVHVLNKDFSVSNKFQIYTKKEYKNFFFKFNLAIDKNTLFIADNFGTVLSYNLATKKIIWKNYLNTPFVSNLVFYKEAIFVTNANGKIYSFNSLNGKQNWSFEADSEYSKSYKAFQISINNDKVLFTNDAGIILCIDLKTKSLLWNKVLVPSENFAGLNVIKFSNLVIEKNYVYVLSNFSNFVKLDINNGNVLWSIMSNSVSRPLISDNNIVFVDKNLSTVIMDKISGKILFQKNLYLDFKIKLDKNKKIINSLLLISDYFFIFANDGSLLKINSSDLSDIKYEMISNQISSNIAISSNDFFFIGDKNKIFKTK